MYRFLIIDDEPVVREGISENIDWASHGFSLVGACRDGREGIAAIEELRPDVVLTDICMPFVDGLELAAFISDRHPETKTILLTGYDEFEYAQEAVKLKVSDFLLKPITADELRRLLNRVRGELDNERRKKEDLEALRSHLKESLPLLRERFLNRLVNGEVDWSEAGSRLALLELTLPGPVFNVMVIDPDGLDGSDELRRLGIEKNVSAVAAEGPDMTTFRSQKEQIVVLLSSANDEEATLRALECAEEVSERIFRTYRTSVSIGIGSPTDDLRRISGCYQEARTALRQRLVLGPNQIVTYAQVRGERSEPLLHSEEQARLQVIRSIKGGNELTTEEAIRSLSDLYRTNEVSIGECAIGMQRLLADLLTAFESLGIHHSEIEELSENPFGRLGELKTLEAVEGWFCRLQRQAHSALSRRQKQHSAEKGLQAVEYIVAHFAESGLSLSRVCRALSISKSYFSPMFKSHTGMTFVEYLTALRIERARDLLLSTDMKSYEIAERVGFSDAHYFSLTFRKQTGESPREFRDSVRGAV